MPAVIALVLIAAADTGPAIVTVERDDTQITRSCRVRIPARASIADPNDDGVIQVAASDIVVEFDEEALRGADTGATPDKYRGIGVRIAGQRNVTLRGLRVSGFRAGVWATNTDGLTLEDCDLSDNRRDRLLSTPQAEDERDWLWPHANDENEWLTGYGAGAYIEDSRNVTVRRCRARAGQNGLCLDRVLDSKIYDNDFSFLSGWGIAMWRSSNNIISRNACDFCIRGYSHGVYNRGQDSAGILAFEQCSQNVFVENSATHGGDGFFGFAGKEALGETPPPSADYDYKRRGCNENVFAKNDFSFAAAHGLELTFSFANRIHGNLFENNAICGIWGGYSQATTILGNDFVENGAAGYGLQRGAINIENGADNGIVANRFSNNACGVHLWRKASESIQRLPWYEASRVADARSELLEAKFHHDQLAIHLRGGELLEFNEVEFTDVAEPTRIEDASSFAEIALWVRPSFLTPRPLGERGSVGARKALRGRENIIMTEWGPWDHESPLVRVLKSTGDTVEFELRRVPKDAKVEANGRPVERADVPAETIAIKAPGPGVHRYSLVVNGPGINIQRAGVLVATEWDLVVFNSPVDPREDAAAWRATAKQAGAVRTKTRALALNYGYKGPSDLLPAAKDRGIARDHFGVIATTTIKLDKGTWLISTLSDDGVRVVVDGKSVIENWSHHGPTRDSAKLTLDDAKAVGITVEHFELDGYAVLEFSIEPSH